MLFIARTTGSMWWMVTVTHESYDSVLVGTWKQRCRCLYCEWWRRRDMERQVVPETGKCTLAYLSSCQNFLWSAILLLLTLCWTHMTYLTSGNVIDWQTKMLKVKKVLLKVPPPLLGLTCTVNTCWKFINWIVNNNCSMAWQTFNRLRLISPGLWSPHNPNLNLDGLRRLLWDSNPAARVPCNMFIMLTSLSMTSVLLYSHCNLRQFLMFCFHEV